METQKTKTRSKHAPDFSSRGKLIFIVSLFVVISILLESALYLQVSIFDGVRSYVRGEGLWAKAQKDAVLYLERYSYSHSESDYLEYAKSVQVMIGDKQARLAMSKTQPDKEEARKGFLQGNNDPSDVESLVWFFLNFRSISYMRDAIIIWQAADKKVEDLLSTGQEFRFEITAAGNRPEKTAVLRERLQHLNNDLLELENNFSIVLGQGARWVRTTAWTISISMLVMFVGIAIFISYQIIRRITQSERELIASESRFRSLKDSNTIGIVSWRMNGLIEEANDIFLEMLGYERSDLIENRVNWKDFTPGDLRPRDQQAVEELIAYGRCEPYEKAMIHKKGHLVPIYVGASLLSGDEEQGIAFIIDLSERKKSEEQLKLAATVFAASNDGILITDPAMHIVSANQALCDMTGYDEDELIGKTPKLLQSGYTTKQQYREIWNVLNNNGNWQGDLVDRMKNGTLVPIRASISTVKNNAGHVTHYVAILSDITERKAEEEHLRHLAHHDTLTGLPNRVLFNDRIMQAIKHAARNNTKFAVLFFDLDDFKPVNDVFGHEVGDKLLQAVAARLSRNVRGTDTVTRLGGDEFVILLEDVADRVAVDNVLNKTVESVCAPCQIDGHDIDIGVSVGVSIYPDDGVDAQSLIHHADIAMYGTKKNKGRRT